MRRIVCDNSLLVNAAGYKPFLSRAPSTLFNLNSADPIAKKLNALSDLGDLSRACSILIGTEFIWLTLRYL